MDVKVPFHHGHRRDLRDSRSRRLGPLVDASVLIPPPNPPQVLSRPCPVESQVRAGLQGRARATCPGRQEREPEAASALGRTPLADAALQPGERDPANPDPLATRTLPAYLERKEEVDLG